MVADFSNLRYNFQLKLDEKEIVGNTSYGVEYFTLQKKVKGPEGQT